MIRFVHFFVFLAFQLVVCLATTDVSAAIRVLKMEGNPRIPLHGPLYYFAQARHVVKPLSEKDQFILQKLERGEKISTRWPINILSDKPTQEDVARVRRLRRAQRLIQKRLEEATKPLTDKTLRQVLASREIQASTRKQKHMASSAAPSAAASAPSSTRRAKQASAADPIMELEVLEPHPPEVALALARLYTDPLTSNEQRLFQFYSQGKALPDINNNPQIWRFFDDIHPQMEQVLEPVVGLETALNRWFRKRMALDHFSTTPVSGQASIARSLESKHQKSRNAIAKHKKEQRRRREVFRVKQNRLRKALASVGHKPKDWLRTDRPQTDPREGRFRLYRSGSLTNFDQRIHRDRHGGEYIPKVERDVSVSSGNGRPSELGKEIDRFVKNVRKYHSDLRYDPLPSLDAPRDAAQQQKQIERRVRQQILRAYQMGDLETAESILWGAAQKKSEVARRDLALLLAKQNRFEEAWSLLDGANPDNMLVIQARGELKRRQAYVQEQRLWNEMMKELENAQLEAQEGRRQGIVYEPLPEGYFEVPRNAIREATREQLYAAAVDLAQAVHPEHTSPLPSILFPKTLSAYDQLREVITEIEHLNRLMKTRENVLKKLGDLTRKTLKKKQG